MDIKLFLLFTAVFRSGTSKVTSTPVQLFNNVAYLDACERVCLDLPKDDIEPVCMMFSRYKRGYQHFINLCHARRAICYENLVLHMVHPSRCMKSGQYYMPMN